MRYANIIPLPRKQYSLCDVLKNSDVDCPVETGDHVITFSVSVPSYVPSVSALLLSTHNEIDVAIH